MHAINNTLTHWVPTPDLILPLPNEVLHTLVSYLTPPDQAEFSWANSTYRQVVEEGRILDLTNEYKLLLPQWIQGLISFLRSLDPDPNRYQTQIDEIEALDLNDISLPLYLREQYIKRNLINILFELPLKKIKKIETESERPRFLQHLELLIKTSKKLSEEPNKIIKIVKPLYNVNEFLTAEWFFSNFGNEVSSSLEDEVERGEAFRNLYDYFGFLISQREFKTLVDSLKHFDCIENTCFGFENIWLFLASQRQVNALDELMAHYCIYKNFKSAVIESLLKYLGDEEEYSSLMHHHFELEENIDTSTEAIEDLLNGWIIAAEYYFNHGPPWRAIELIKKVFRHINDLTDFGRTAVMQILAKHKCIDEALRLAEQEGYLLKDIVKELVENDLLDEASKVLEKIEESSDDQQKFNLGSSCALIVEGYIKIGNSEKAILIYNKFPSIYRQDYYLITLKIKMLVELNRIEEALMELTHLQTNNALGKTLLKLINIYLERDDIEGALHLARLGNSFDPQTLRRQKLTPLVMIAEYLEKKERTEEAQRLMEEVNSLLVSQKNNIEDLCALINFHLSRRNFRESLKIILTQDPLSLIHESLSKLIYEAFIAKSTIDAEDLIVASQIPHVYYKNAILDVLIKKLIDQDNLEWARRGSEHLTLDEFKSRYQSYLALYHHSKGASEQALAQAEEAFTLANQVEDNYWHSHELLTIVKIFITLGNKEGTLGAAYSIPIDSYKNKGFLSVIEFLISKNDLEQAEQILSLMTEEPFNSGYYKSCAGAALAKKYQAKANEEKSQQLFHEAERLAQNIRSIVYKDLALKNLEQVKAAPLERIEPVVDVPPVEVPQTPESLPPLVVEPLPQQLEKIEPIITPPVVTSTPENISPSVSAVIPPPLPVLTQSPPKKNRCFTLIALCKNRIYFLALKIMQLFSRILKEISGKIYRRAAYS